MQFLKSCFFTCCFCMLLYHAQAQQERDRAWSIGLFNGVTSYQGDLQPNSFSFQETRFMTGVYLRKPILEKFSIKAGFNTGKLFAADAFNRDYLKVRNLSFSTRINEAFLTLDYFLFTDRQRRFSPFAYGGIVYFHFNPYTFDRDGNKFYLQPLGTEGQGLSRYPERRLYKLNQVALAFGGGMRFFINNALSISLEAAQRKTFTDYLDDVSSSYADEDALLAGRGAKAVELAYRGDELPGGASYPKEGEQRGSPTQMDWYYFAGISLEVKLNGIAGMFGGTYESKRSVNQLRCPKVTY